MEPADQPDEALTISEEARSERRARRVAGLERQLAVRIASEEDLRRQLAHFQRVVSEGNPAAEGSGDVRAAEQAARARESALDAELASTRAQLAAAQAELAALLNTKTMRLAREPRRLYANLRANPTARSALSRLGL